MFNDMNMNYEVSLKKVIEKLEVEQLNPEVEIDKIMISQDDVNRPALQLAGFFEHFDNNRVQVIGMVEYTYVSENYNDGGASIYERIFQVGVPCIIFCRNLRPADEVVRLATQYKVPIFLSARSTSRIISKTIRILALELRPGYPSMAY